MCVRLPARPTRASGAITVFPSLRTGVLRNVGATLREASEDDPEERMAVHTLRKRARIPDHLGLDQAEHGPQDRVFRQRQQDGEASSVDVGSPADEVERDSEEGAVERVHAEPADELHVRVVAAEQTPVERLLQSPHGGGDGSCQCCAHTLSACPKGTPFIAPRSACRCWSDRSSRSRPRIRAQRSSSSRRDSTAGGSRAWRRSARTCCCASRAGSSCAATYA